MIVTEWEQFRALDFRRLKQLMTRAVLVNLRNIYRPDEVERHGFVHVGIGRAPRAPEPHTADSKSPTANVP